MVKNRKVYQGVRYTVAAILLFVTVGCGTKKNMVQTVEKTTTTNSKALRKVTAGKILSVDEKRRYDYFYIEALKQKLNENHDAAFELYGHCVELNPEAGEAIYELSLYYQYFQMEEKAEELLVKANQLEPDNAWYKETLASLYINKRNIPKAIPVLEDIVDLNPKRTDVLSQLVALYMNVENYSEAIRTLDRIELLEGKEPQVSLEKYRLYMKLENEKKAFQELESLARDFPNELSYRVLIADQYLLVGKEKKALEIFEEVRKKEPDNDALQMSLLDYYKQTGKDSLYTAYLDTLLYGERTESEVRMKVMRDFIQNQEKEQSDSTVVLQAFERILAQKQDNINILALYAVYMEMKKMGTDSIAAVMYKILDIEPDNQMALYQLLQYHARKNEYQKMVAICQHGLQYYPEQLTFYFYLGVSYYQMDKTNEALDAFERGVKQIKPENDPVQISELYAVMGDLLYQKKQIKAAFEAYETSLTYRADNLSCLNNYAYYLSLLKKDLDKAEEMSYRTIKQEPDNKIYLDTYAWILFIKGKYSEAKIYMEKVIKEIEDAGDAVGVLPEDALVSAGVLEHAGDIYYQCGEKEKALKYWKLSEINGGNSVSLKKKITLKKYIE